jgi:putative ABC transport system permease protein
VITHYLSTALRHFRRHKLTTAINVLCLTLGLMCFVVAWGTVSYFEQRDRYHANADRTYFMTWSEQARPREQLTGAFLLAPQLRADFPELDGVARLIAGNGINVRLNGRGYYADVSYADPEFFRIFDIPLIGADPRTVLSRPHTAIVTPAYAKRVFGTEDVIGRTLDLDGRAQVTIEGLIGRIPQPSNFSTEQQRGRATINFEVLASMDTRVSLLASRVAVPGEGRLGGWDPDGTLTFLMLPKQGALTLDEFNTRLTEFARRSIPPGPVGPPVLKAHRIAEVLPLETAGMVGTLSGPTILQILGMLILLVACVNYANLAAAIAGERMRDVALRKVVGATGRAVMAQYLFEAFLLTGVALIVAIGAAVAVVAGLRIAAVTELAASFAATPAFWVVIAATIIGVSVAAGAYPAFVLARVRPIRIIRGGRGGLAGSRIATVLLTVQFAFASMMIIGVLTMLTQYRELKSAIWQPDTDPIIMLFSAGAGSKVDRTTLRTELERIPGVLGVTGAVQALWDPGSYPIDLVRSEDAAASRILASINVVNYDFLATLRIPLLAGRDFDRGHAEDVSDLRPAAKQTSDRNVIIDRRLAERLGFTNPQDAVGSVIIRTAEQTTPAARRATSTRYHVVGVADSALLNPLPGTEGGDLFLLDPYTAVLPFVRISRRDVSGTVAAINAVWKQLAPGQALSMSFADEYFERAFDDFRRIERTLTALAGFALAICTMGLIGMALHLIRRRTHEIGVRKTLGASVTQILALLLRAFAKPIAIANVAVWIPMIFAASAYTSMFAKSVGVPVMPFVASLAITLAVACAAVSVQVTRAARSKPSEVLRHE